MLYMKITTKLMTLLLTLLLAGTVQAGLMLDDSLLDTDILGGRFFVADDGAVEATFLGSDAGYFNTLFLYSPAPSVPGGIYLFDKDSDYGASVDLGEFDAGTELVFRLLVKNTGLNFYSGAGSDNPDSLPHAMAVTTLLSDDSYLTTVGFEDLRGGGDLDYNDFMFSLSNVIDPPAIPEPSVLLLLAIGLIGLSVMGRRRRYTRAARI
jgi:Domain of unknown function (DUF4114)/PEP-CTERM motif